MSRIDAIKRVGFPIEECPKCFGDDDDCEVCHGTGKFQQRLRPDWEPPVLNPWERLVAYLDCDEWAGFGIVNADGDLVRELDFPFATEFATASHLKTIGFEVEQ